MLANVRLFKVTSFSSSTGPAISGEPIKPYEPASGETEINNISVELTPDTSERTLQADNTAENDAYVKGFSGTLTVYGIDADFLSEVLGYEKDSNENTNLVINNAEKNQFVMFYRGKNEKGAKYNMWLYDVEFKPFNLPATQDGDTPSTLALTFYAKGIILNSKQTIGSIVYEGNEGYVAEGTEPTSSDLYIPAAA